MSDAKYLTPEVTWAQRSSSSEASKNIIYLTIVAPDVDAKDYKLDVQEDSLTFKGYSQTKKAGYEVQLDFYAAIDPKESKIHHSSRSIELVLRKKELNEEYWPRLLKEKKKLHFLKTDFDKWVDEDEQDANPEDDDYMSKMAGMGGGMGGMGGDGGFGGIDFSKLGAMGGMGGMGGMGDMDEEEDEEEDDEEMPELGEASESKGSAKIEEIN